MIKRKNPTDLNTAVFLFISETKQSHTSICVVDHHSDGTYGLRALKQKIYVDGLCYLLQEIYGIENKNINKVYERGSQSFLNLYLLQCSLYLCISVCSNHTIRMLFLGIDR